VQGFLGYTLLKRDKHSFGPPMRGTTERNYGQWVFKKMNSKPWQIILPMMQEEGPMLFASKVGSLIGKGWQT
jgi:hypothetical protein